MHLFEPAKLPAGLLDGKDAALDLVSPFKPDPVLEFVFFEIRRQEPGQALRAGLPGGDAHLNQPRLHRAAQSPHIPLVFVTLTLSVGPGQFDLRIANRFRVELDSHMAVFAVFGGMNDRNDAADVGDRAARLEIADHVQEVFGRIERVLLQRFEGRDALLVDAKLVVRLAQVEIDLERIKGRRELRPHFAMVSGHDLPKHFRQCLLVVMLPELFDIGGDPLIEDDRRARFHSHPPGIHLDFFVFGHHTVVGPIDRGDRELAGQRLLSVCAVGVHAIGRSPGGRSELGQLDFFERDPELFREHFIHGIELMYPTRR